MRAIYDVAVVGAGAAGLMAAIGAGRAGARVVALDSASKIGAKILISGGGRCNITHDVVTAGDFNGNRNVVGRILRTFSVSETIEFFRAIGVELKREENGKLFPVSNQARTVVDALLGAASDAGVTLLTAHRVLGIAPSFRIETARGAVEAPCVVLATGGRSVPKTGSDGFGYTLAAALGHSVVETFPALVPLVVAEGHWMRGVSGTSVLVDLAVVSSSGRVLERERGSMLLAHFGVTGPVVLDISRHWIAARRADPGAALVANFLPGETFDTVDKSMMEASRENSRATVSSLFRGRVPQRILDAVAPQDAISRLSREARRLAVRALVEQEIPIVRDRGMEYAEVTAGGVPLSEVDPATMQSRCCSGLYICGEVLDVDGRIGGFNFQWAWSSGKLAGTSAASAARRATE